MYFFIQNNDLFLYFYISIVFCVSYVVFTTNLIYSVVALLLTFILFSMFFILLGAELIGIFFILVYAGALCIFMLFILINFNLQVDKEIFKQLSFKYFLMMAIFVVLIFFRIEEFPMVLLKDDYYSTFFSFLKNGDYVFFYDSVFLNDVFLNKDPLETLFNKPTIQQLFTNCEQLALLIFVNYAFIFFLLGILLYVAMLGSLFILLSI